MIAVFNKKKTHRVGDDEVIFDVDQSFKRPLAEDDECYGIDDLDEIINVETQELLGSDKLDSFLVKGLEKSINQADLETSANEIDEKKPELKDLPHQLEYAYLHGDKSFPIIISSNLSKKEKMLLLQVLEKHIGAFAWKMSNIKGIMKNKTVKLLDSGLIYPITDSLWVSPIHVVPKKGGMTVVLNDNNALIPSRMITGWQVILPNSNCTQRSRKGDVHLSLWKIFLQKNVVRIMQRTCNFSKMHDGAENLVADYLSRLENPDFGIFTEEEIADEFPNKHLMMLKAKPNDDEPWICPNNIMRLCIVGSEILEILAYFHSRPTRGHYSASITRRKRLGNISSRSEMPQNNIQCNMDLAAAAKNRFMEFNELMELRDRAYENTRIYKERTKKWNDSRLRGDKDFKVGDKVLLFNSRLRMHLGKIKSKWYGTNVVKTVYPYRTVKITNKNGISFKVTGQRLKKYYDGHIDTEDKEVVEFNEDTT
ncbi:hypothetical protein Tco_0152982 [Tanacetum coccineum]